MNHKFPDIIRLNLDETLSSYTQRRKIMFNNAHTNRYKTHREDNKTIATASFAGKPVHGYAKCHPDDEFTAQLGEDLAVVRCAEKINEKRVRNASKKLAEARRNLDAAQAHYAKMEQYLKDADNEAVVIANEKARLMAILA